jgi:hypothetical protein
MTEWKAMLGPDLEMTYGLSNIIYVARPKGTSF